MVLAATYKNGASVSMSISLNFEKDSAPSYDITIHKPGKYKRVTYKSFISAKKRYLAESQKIEGSPATCL